MKKIARKKLAAHVVNNPSPLTVRQVAAHLVATGRTRQLELLIRDIEKAALQNGRIVVHVTSAHTLSSAQQSNIEKFVKSLHPGTRHVEQIHNVDAWHLGGVVVRTPEKVYSASLRLKLDQLKKNT